MAREMPGSVDIITCDSHLHTCLPWIGWPPANSFLAEAEGAGEQPPFLSSLPRSLPVFGSNHGDRIVVSGLGSLPDDVLERWVQIGQERVGISLK